MRPYPSAPEPDEGRSLVPPSGRPPTAVGTATPEPPEKPSRNSSPEPPSRPAYNGRVSLVARIGNGMLGTLFVVGGVALLTVPGAGRLLGAALGAMGVDVITRSLSGRGLWIHWKHVRRASHRRRRLDRGKAA